MCVTRKPKRTELQGTADLRNNDDFAETQFK